MWVLALIWAAVPRRLYTKNFLANQIQSEKVNSSEYKTWQPRMAAVGDFSHKKGGGHVESGSNPV